MENGQARTTSLDHLDHCCRLVSELYGKPDIVAWTNSDYIRLGYILYKKTQVQISPNTLKRIFGKIKTDVRYYPQKATRDALARYVGYADWEKFTEAKPNLPIVPLKIPKKPTDPAQIVTVAPEPIVIRKRRSIWLRTGLIVFTVFALAVLISYKVFVSTVPPAHVKLICENPVGENPHSAVFLIRGMETISDPNENYVIDFGDSRKIRTVSGDSLYSHYYEVPGRYLAILKCNEVPIDTVSIYLKTNGWTATGEMMNDTSRVYPVEKANLISEGAMHVSTSDIAHAGIDTNRTFFVKFINTQITDIDGDNFDLFIKLKTSPDRAGVRCSQVRVTVFGETSKHLVDAMKPGCVHWTDLQFSEINKQGESNQLNFLGVDLHEGGSLEMKVAEKHAQVLINSKQVYETDYEQPLKKIYGLNIAFSGIGAVNSVMLKDLKTGKMFAGNFE